MQNAPADPWPGNPGQRQPPAAPSNPVTAAVRKDDLALAERCRAGEPGAFDALYAAHAPRLFGLACRLVGREEADDLFQEILLNAYRKLGSYRGQSALGTWLFRLGTNQCLDYLRSRRARAAQLTESIGDEPGSAGAAAGAILHVVDRIDLERALDELPAGCREVFVLHDIEGLEHREVGELLGVSEGTSKSQLHKARMRLRAALGRAGRGGDAR